MRAFDKFEQMSEKEREQHFLNLKRMLARSGQNPRTPSELHRLIKVVHGINLPTTATTEDADPPFEFFANTFFHWDAHIAAIASRGGGKTFMVAESVKAKGQFQPGIRMRHAAATRTQADVAKEYLDNALEDPVYGGLIDRRKTTKSSAVWHNGSKYAIVTGSKKGVSGQHVPSLFLDEVEFMDQATLNQSFGVPVSEIGLPPQWCAVSTRQNSTGGMAWLYDTKRRGVVDNGKKGTVRFYRWTLFETMQPCQTCIAIDQEPYGTDEARQNVCPLWAYCHGERAKKASGWLTLSEAIDKIAPLSLDEIETQYLSERPLTKGRVLYNFNEEGNYPIKGNISDYRYNPLRPYIIGYDPSEGQVAFFVFLQMDDLGNWHAFDELRLDPCSDPGEAKEELFKYLMDNRMAAPENIIVDPRRSDAIRIMRRGIPTGTGMDRSYPGTQQAPIKILASGHRSDLIIPTLQILRSWIQNGAGRRRFFVNKDKCPFLLRAIKYHGYKLDPKTGEPTPVPSNNFKDEIDALRYAFIWIDHVYGRSDQYQGVIFVDTTTDATQIRAIEQARQMTDHDVEI